MFSTSLGTIAFGLLALFLSFFFCIMNEPLPPPFGLPLDLPPAPPFARGLVLFWGASAPSADRDGRPLETTRCDTKERAR